jgi:hypothetical protein
MALWYTMAGTCLGLTLPIAATFVLPSAWVSKLDGALDPIVQLSERGWVLLAVVVVASVACAVLLRYLLLTLFNTRR